MNKWIKIRKYAWTLGGQVEIFDRIVFYAGTTDHWGIGFNVNFYDRAITFEIFNLYFGVEVWRRNNEIIEFVPKRKGDLLD